VVTLCFLTNSSAFLGPIPYTSVNMNTGLFFAFSNTATHGANALKLENEIVTENFNESVDDVNNQYHEELLKNQEVESIVEKTSEEKEVSFSQEAIENSEVEKENTSDLKEFGVDINEPDLFNNENQTSSSEDLLGSTEENDHEEDDLEIPAFLRRQKN